MGRRARIQTTARDAVAALNWMNGCGDACTFEPDSLQEEVLGRVFYLSGLAGERDGAGSIPPPEAAL